MSVMPIEVNLSYICCNIKLFPFIIKMKSSDNILQTIDIIEVLPDPTVADIKDEKLFKMWYSAGEKYEPDVICYAISKDGKNWITYKNNPIFKPNINKLSLDFYKVGGSDVHKISKKNYLMI